MRKVWAMMVVLWVMAVGLATAQTCPSTVTSISPSATSCWPLQETSGTTITDTIDSNSGTISGAYTLNQNGGIACNNSVTGCSIVTPQLYSNPQPMTLYLAFAGTSGGILQLGTSSSLSAVPSYVLFLDNHGKLTFGVNNLGNNEVLQSPQPYADGNEHLAVISVGAAGMRMYVDGQEVAERNVQLANYVNGYLFFGGINTAGWPLSPSLQQFNGTLYTFAWWAGTQLTDQQGITLTGGNPNVIGNSYCTFTNQLASLNPSQAMAFANKNLTFTLNPNQLQNPGGGSNLPIGPSTQVCKTDGTGNILAGCQIPQGAHVNLSVGTGPPIPLVIPFSTSCDLTAIMLSQTDPPEVVSAVAVAGPLFNGATVTNPPAGTIGTATITSPPSYQVSASTAISLDIGTNGNLQAVTMGASIPITLTNIADGAVFQVDTVENGTGGWTPTFQLQDNSACTGTATPYACCTGSGTGTCGNPVFAWPSGGSQPAMPSTAAGAHNLWNFAVEGTTVVGSVSASGGGFPLSATANFNNYSAININSASFVQLPAPSATVISTCSGTCATVYTYEVTCLGDNSTNSAPTGALTASNAASLSSSNFNTVNWPGEVGCYSGYDVYGRIGGSLGLLATVAYGTNSYKDTGTVSPGAAPPTSNDTGSIFLGGQIIGNNSVILSNNNPAFNGVVDILGPAGQTGDFLDVIKNGVAQFVIGANGTAGNNSSINTDSLMLKGASSGQTTITVPAAAGTPTIVLPNNSGVSGYALSTDGSGNTSWINNKGGGFGSNACPGTPIAISSASNTTITSVTATAPATGGPYRALVSYFAPITNSTAVNAVECSVSDGSNSMGASEVSLPASGLNDAGAAVNSVLSPVGYTQGSSNTFTLTCRADNGSATAQAVATGVAQGNACGMQVSYVPSG